MRPEYKESLYLTWVMGGLNMLGYLIITTFLGVTEVSGWGVHCSWCIPLVLSNT